jgi:selenocysteine lyase/cysteine desulfurase
MSPPIFGWHNVRCPDFVAQERITFRNDARKYEAGTHNLLGVVGLVAAMGLVLEIGIDNISEELLRKRARLAASLQAKGYTVLLSDAPSGAGGGIVSFHRDGDDPSGLHQKLSEANMVTSLRTDRAGRRYIRLSPHFYNTDEELDRVLERL